MSHFLGKTCLDDETQDVAEYSVMPFIAGFAVTAEASSPRAKCLFNGRATVAHHAVTWVWGGHVQPWRARSLPSPLACGSCHSGC